MALVIIYAVLSHFDFVAKFTVKNLNKDFTNTGRGGGHHFMKVFHKIELCFKDGFPQLLLCVPTGPIVKRFTAVSAHCPLPCASKQDH